MLSSTELTLQYYNNHAHNFADRTGELSMDEIQKKFAGQLKPGARILDFGCGSGRDTASLIADGFNVDALDGSAELCRIAALRTGIKVQHILFEEFRARDTYDGIWACASVLHLPRQPLKHVLDALGNALKADGILYISFKYGTFEGERDGRYFTDMTPDSFVALLNEAAPGLLGISEQWITQDVRPDRRERWLNLILHRL